MSVKEQFSPEEREDLNYVGSMLSRPNTPFEQAVEDALAGEEVKENLQRHFRWSLRFC